MLSRIVVASVGGIFDLLLLKNRETKRERRKSYDEAKQQERSDGTNFVRAIVGDHEIVHFVIQTVKIATRFSLFWTPNHNIYSDIMCTKVVSSKNGSVAPTELFKQKAVANRTAPIPLVWLMPIQRITLVPFGIPFLCTA
jgi:hypothetical protein